MSKVINQQYHDLEMQKYNQAYNDFLNQQIKHQCKDMGKAILVEPLLLETIPPLENEA